MDCDVGNSLLKEAEDSLIEQNKILAKVKFSNIETQDPASYASADSQTSELQPVQTSPVTPQESEDAKHDDQGQGDTDVEELERSCPSDARPRFSTVHEIMDHRTRHAVPFRIACARDDLFYDLEHFLRPPASHNLPRSNMNIHISGEYNSAPKIFSPFKTRTSEVSVADDGLEDLRKGLGAFQHLPCDFRLHYSIETHNKQEVLTYITRATNFIRFLNTQRGSNAIRIYDCDCITGLHAYSVTEYRRDERRRKPSSNCPGGICAPWSRLIVCEGLLEARNQPSFCDLTCFFASQTKFAGMQLDSFVKYLGDRSPFGINIGQLNDSTTTMRFQMTNYALVPKSEWGSSSKASGPLYGDESQLLAHEVSGLFAISGEGSLYQKNLSMSSYPNYTIFLVLPRSKYGDEPRQFSVTSSSMHWHILDIIWNLLRSAIESWFEILLHMRDLLQEEGKPTVILTPEMHDRLFFEDEFFSRSRKFFWAVDALETFEGAIKSTTREWVQFRRECIEPFTLSDGVVGTVPLAQSPCWDNPTDFLGRIEDCVENLESTRKEFRELRDRAEVMRRSLFSASAAVETRAATQLGENVRLLAYVSIFYLPLAFCTSLWSINHIPSQPTFACVVVAVASATYLVVFNLQSLVALARRPYDGYKRMTVKQMKTDTDPKWIETARNFEQFRARRERMIPTSWLLPLYSLLRIASLIGLRRTASSSAALESGSEASEHNSVEALEINLPSSSSKSSLVSWLRAWSPLKGASNTTKADADPPSEHIESVRKAHQSGWIRSIARRRDKTNLASSAPELP